MSGRLKFGEVMDGKEIGNYSFRVGEGGGSGGEKFGFGVIKVKSESEGAQSCPTLRDPMDCSPPGSLVDRKTHV